MHRHNQTEENQSAYLSTLGSVPAMRLKPFVKSLLPGLGRIDVLTNRTELVMVPRPDTAQGANLHLCEVLVSEAHVRLHIDAGIAVEGYGACLGRDLEQSLAIAILDAALRGNVMTDAITNFICAEANVQVKADDQPLRHVEALCMETETF